MKIPKDVDAYIKLAPKEFRAKLIQLRRIIWSIAPKAKESIYYQMPYYDYYGPLIWFGVFKNYIGIYLRPPVIAEHKKDLKLCYNQVSSSSANGQTSPSCSNEETD
jgi:uncharacterized protein YdhG (YjbR/CyaY superfamily)